tara:strand:+ start:319 stop:831 length:513 start_codon:yes stop_codon:yes gene_type:complete
MDNKKDINDDVIRDFLKKSSGQDFDIPEDYFKGFQSKVQSKINQEKKYWLLLPKIKFAFVGIACLLFSIFVLKDFQDNINVTNIEFSKKELLAYYFDNIDEISEDEILEIIILDDFEFITQKTSNDSTKIKDQKKDKKIEKAPNLEDFTDEEIFEYMLDEGYETGDWDNL